MLSNEIINGIEYQFSKQNLNNKINYCQVNIAALLWPLKACKLIVFLSLWI